MKKFASIVGAVIIAGALVGCSTEVQEVSNSDTETQESQTEEKQEPQDKTYKVGDTVSIDGLEVTLNKASFTDPAQYTPAEQGKVLTIELSSINNSENQKFIDATDFNLYDKEGNQLQPYYGYNEMAISGDVNKGKKLAGKLYFDVPEQGSYELIYTPFFSFDNAEIKFEVTPQ